MKKFLREYRVELLALLLTVVGIFLLVEQFEIRTSLKNFLFGSGSWLLTFARSIGDWFVVYLENFTLSDMTGWILILMAAGFVFWRVRYRLSKSDAWSATVCPRCGGPLHRQHRSSLDHLILWAMLPSGRRYACSNPQCQWSGLRRRRASSHHHHAPEEEFADAEPES